MKRYQSALRNKHKRRKHFAKHGRLAAIRKKEGARKV